MCGLTLCIAPVDADVNASTHPTNCNSLDNVIHNSEVQATFQQLLHSLHDENRKRGPDTSGVFATRVPTPAGDLLVTLGSSVLGLRGTLTAQPLIGSRGVLAWNGQVFAGLPVAVDENDTHEIFERLEAGGCPEEVFAGVEGPFVYIYYQYATMTVHFGLDPLSRRSLLAHSPGRDSTAPWFFLTSARSTAARTLGVPMRALDGGMTGVLDLSAVRLIDGIPDYTAALRTWTVQPLQRVNTALPLDDVDPLAAAEAECPHFVKRLTDAVRRRVQNIPRPVDGSARVALLFSGGVDCSLLAALVHRCLPEGEPVELVNVAFEQPAKAGQKNVGKPDKVKSKLAQRGKYKGKGKGTDTGPENTEDTSPVSGPSAQAHTPVTEVDVNTGGGTPPSTAPPSPSTTPTTPLQDGYNVPDRLSGLAAAAELRAACPGRDFRFVAVNIDVETARAARQEVVDLMYPSNTEMDVSLAYPLFFASRGVGVCNGEPYRVAAKVYLSGLGADEQLAGYTRHRRAFDRGSWTGLIQELQLDVDRLPQRNLSRDDRMLSSHARDARYPFLDLAFVDYVSALPVWHKCDLTKPPGQGDKRLIRLAAASCGLPETAQRVKRAMQFGTRSAKLNDAGSKGHRVGEGLITECM